MPRHLMRDLCRWQRITLLKDRKTREFVQRLQRLSNDPEAINRLSTLIEENLGFSLFQAIEQAKRDLSSDMDTRLVFNESVIAIDEKISRPDFEDLSDTHITDIKSCIDQLLATSGLTADQIDSFFITGGTSYIPAVQQVLTDTFGVEKMRTGDAFISVAAGLALSRGD